MKKTVVGTLFLMVSIVVCVQFVDAQYVGDISINADGSMSPSTAPIQQTRTVYTLSGNIAGSLAVHASNIVFDGNGHTVSSILLEETENVTVKSFVVRMQNEFTERIGLSLSNASNNIIVNNTITRFWSIQALNGILFAGIHIIGGNSNTIAKNSLVDNLDGIAFANTSYNLVVQNNITSSPIWSPFTTLISLSSSSNNTIYHNNFVNGTYQAKAFNSINLWDDDQIGNYWSNYQTKYPNASMIGDSGIGNTPYFINENNIDQHPLMQPLDISSSIPTPTPTASESAPTPTTTGQSYEAFATTSIVLIALLAAIVVSLFLYRRHRKISKANPIYSKNFDQP